MKQNVAAERAVLAGLCQFGIDVYYEIGYVETSTFTDVGNQDIFRCLERIFKDSNEIDLSSILSAATELSLYEEIANENEMGYVRSLFNMPISKEGVSANAARIVKLKFADDAAILSERIKTDLGNVNGDESLVDLISMIEGPLLDFTASVYKESDNTPQKISDNIDQYLQELVDNPVEMIGISTGFKHLDKAIGGGLRRKCVDLFGARPKVGKSLMCDAFAVNVSKRGIPVLVLDSEMSKEDHISRILASMSGVEINDIVTGKFSLDPMKRRSVNEALAEFKNLNYHFVSVAGMNFSSILGIMRNWLYREVGFDENGRTNDCVIVYDYLKLMDASGMNQDMKEHQLLGFQITQLHNFAVKYDVSIPTFIQLNRDGITKESTDAASGSDRLIWLCTSFNIFKVKSEEELAHDGEERGNRKIVPIVARHGGGLDDGDYINYNLDGAIGKITELENRNHYLRGEDGFENDTTGTDLSDY